MHFQGGNALLSLLLAGLVIAVTPQDMTASVMPENNNTTLGFPSMTPEFKEMAKKLMLKCSEMGYRPPAMSELPYNSLVDVEEETMLRNPISLFPSLLSSLPPPPPLPDLTSSRMAHLPNSSVDMPDSEADWNVTEELWNVTTLPDMIDIMKNSTDHPRCFMQAFISPVAWFAITHSGLQLRLEDLAKLLWAAKPFLQNMLPDYIELPPHLDQPRLVQMMNMFSEVFSSLSEEQMDQIRDWVKARVLENEYGCASNNPTWGPNKPLPWGMETSKPIRPGQLKPVRPLRPLRPTSAIVMQSEEDEEQIGKGAGKEKEKENSKEAEGERPRGEEEEEEEESKEKKEGKGRWHDKLKDRWQKKTDEVTEGNHTGVAEREKDGETKVASEEGKKTWEKKVKEVIGLSGEVEVEEEGHDGNEKQPERKGGQKEEMLSLGDGREFFGSGRELERVEEEEREKVESQWTKREVKVGVGGQRERDKQKIGGSDNHMLGIGEREKDGGSRENKREEGKSNESGTSERGDDGVMSEENSNGGEIWSDRNKSGTGEREEDGESEEEKDGRGKNWEDNKKERRGSEEEDGERALKLVPCPPHQPWLNRTVLRIMGRFLSRLLPEEVKAVPSDELCEFFRSPDFPRSFQRVGAIRAPLGRTLMGRLEKCTPSKQEFLQHTASLGSLVCFYDGGAWSLDETTSKRLLAQLEECQNSDSTKLKKQLVRKLFSLAKANSGPELLESLGSAASALPPSKLIQFSAQALANTLPSLSKAPWSAAQAKTLAKALLTKTQNISSSALLSLGTLVRGVSSSLLRNMQGRELLRAEEKDRLESISQKMTPLQRKALLKGMRSDVSVSQLVLNVPEALLASLSLSTLRRAQLTSVEQLEGRKWTRAQSAFLLKKLLGQRLKPQHLRKLGRAIQGVTCEMIDSLSQNETMEGIEVLSQSSGWLAKTEICCAARKLFETLELEREDYFRNVSEAELQSIPAMMLIHLPARRIKALPDSVCGVFLEKMRAVNLSCLPNSSPSRSALTKRALDCLGKNMSDVSAEELQSLGPLLCELDPPQLRSLAPEVLNSTLQELASCPYIRRRHRAELWSMVTDTFGQPSDWSEEDVQSLGRFLLMDDVALKTLPDRPWLKSSLSDLMDSLPFQPSGPVPEEFRLLPDLSSLRWKLFVLNTRDNGQSSAPTQRRRRREVLPVGTPTSDLIEQLGEDNVFWSPAQLANLSAETFTESASQLGEIRDFTAEQLASLCRKVKELWGPVDQLNESQVVELGCVSQAFSAEELLQLNISSLDTLELLATCKWTQAQRRAVWQGFTKRTGVSAAQLGELEMVGLGQFICGLQTDEVRQLSNDSFREAAEAVGCTPCEMPQLEDLKRKAVSVFGEPQSWSEGQVMALGNIMAGLDAAELQSLNSSVFSFIMCSAIPLIPPKHLAALSVSQLKALGPDNAAMVTDAQKAEMDEEQKSGLAEAVGVAYTRSEEPSPGGSQSGAVGQESSPVPQTGGSASHNMEGIGVLLKPVLFLLLGFMF